MGKNHLPPTCNSLNSNPRPHPGWWKARMNCSCWFTPCYYPRKQRLRERETEFISEVLPEIQVPALCSSAETKSNLANADAWSLHNSVGTNIKSCTVPCSQQHHLSRIHGCLLPNAAVWGFAICCSYCYSHRNAVIPRCSTAHSTKHRHIKTLSPGKPKATSKH